MYEGTIGAGLPIVSTLRTLRASGDQVKSVQGIFSGTMSFLFNTWDPTTPFSDVVLAARAAGYTEPDPRDDLNGMGLHSSTFSAQRKLFLWDMLGGVSLSVENTAQIELQSGSVSVKDGSD
jgi:hypothetical protein